MKRRYGRLHKKGISLLMAAACVSVLVAGCGQAEEEETMSEVIPVQVQKPEAGALTLKNEFVGTVTPEESVYVISMVTAEVLSTNVSVGDVVNAGDILCELDSEAAELQLASAQVQYDSAAANVNAAQVGYEMAQSQYEMAQSQYEGTIAQLDAQMGGQKNLQLYQLQAGIDTINSGIEDMIEQKSDLEEQIADAQEQKDDLKDYVDQAKAGVKAAENLVNIFDSGDEMMIIAVMTQMGYKSFEVGDKDAAKKIAEKQLSEAQSAYSQLKTMYEQAEAGVDALKDGKEQLDNTLSNTYMQLEQAEVAKNITEDQIYKDTQKIVDANKKTAALSMGSAALGIDSAQASMNAAQVGVKGAQVAIDSAEYQLDMYKLKAPIGGVIEAANVKEHDFATPSSPAYIISNKDTMMVTFYVSEGIRNTLTVGQQVSVDRNGKLFDAAITEIGSMIDQTTGLFAVKACVSAPDESMLTGCSVKVTADTYSQDSVLLIPYDAVYYDDSQPYVYIAVGNVVERRDIETGIFDAQTITVLSGLTTDDQLITSWSANLREGAVVSIQTTQDFAADNAAVSEE